MDRQKVRIRFRKQGDLRLIGHRDLARTFERLFRRAGLPLSMSQGFHPKPRLNFPSALALGIEGTDEVMEVELSHPISSDSLAERLNRHAPSGLTICATEVVAALASKPQVERVVYEISVPVERRPAVREAMGRLLAQPKQLVQRPRRKEPIDLLANLIDLQLADGVLRMALRVTSAASASPRDILQALSAADLERRGGHLTRTKVELAS